MYEAYFGLTERPFSIAPDPQYLYMSSRHKEAMAHLSYGLLQGGCFIVLTGEVGTGKTTLCRNLLVELPDNVDVALVLNANINEQELLQTVCDELKIDYQQEHSQKQLLDRINKHLLSSYSQGRHTVLIIDEAQLLSRDVLEQIRLLTNLETTKAKLLQIILIGQPELNDLLSRNDLRQLAQRVTARYHLGELKASEIEDYVNFRLGVAGCKQHLFSRQALNRLHRLTDGIPRKINVLADHALLATYADNQRLVDAKTVQAAAGEVFISAAKGGHTAPWLQWLKRYRFAAIAGVLLVLFNLLLWWWFAGVDNAPPPAASVSSDATSIAEPVQSSGARTIAPVDSSPTEPDAKVVTNAESVTNDESVTNAESVMNDAEGAIDDTESATLDAERTTLDAGDAVASAQEIGISIVGATDTPGNVVISEEFLDASPSSESDASASGDAAPAQVTRGLQTEFGDALETAADLTGRIDAFRQLANEWGETLPTQIIPPACEVVAATGLRCQSFDNWQQLLRSNRPAILVVSHDEQLHRVLVTLVSDNFAAVRLGARSYTVPVDELRARWTRSGVLFWRPAADAGGLLQLNDEGAMVLAARGYLNQALARAALPLLNRIDSTVFDLDMSQKVFALQTRFGLSGDSMIGNETWMLINEFIRPGQTPVLRERLPSGAAISGSPE